MVTMGSFAKVAMLNGVFGMIVPVVIVGSRYAVLGFRPVASTFIMNTLAVAQAILWPTSFMLGPINGHDWAHYYLHDVLPSVGANVVLYAVAGTLVVSIYSWCHARHGR